MPGQASLNFSFCLSLTADNLQSQISPHTVGDRILAINLQIGERGEGFTQKNYSMLAVVSEGSKK